MILFVVGHEIRRYIHNAKEFEYGDAVIAGRRIQAIDVDPETKVTFLLGVFYNINGKKCMFQ